LYTLCGTPEYLAPELLTYRGHDMTCDWWSFGIIIYEFLSNQPPFYEESGDRQKLYEKILSGKIEWPRYFDSASKDLIKKLLVQDPAKRLGSGNCGTILIGTFSAIANSTLAESTQHETSLTSNEIPSPNSTISSDSKPPQPAPRNHMSLQQKISSGCEEVKRHRWFISITDWSDVSEKRLKPPFLPELTHESDLKNFDQMQPVDLTNTQAVTERDANIFWNF
jgi:serine/threonine protein kinase